jgi:hypothetical protein
VAFKKEKVGTRTQCPVCEEDYKPINASQHFCAEECAWQYWHALPPGRKGKALAREVAIGFGFRSLAELGFQVKMNAQGITDSCQVDYEPEHIKWQPKIKSYTPDWKITRPNGTFFFVEFKGKLDQVTRSILLGVKHSHPDLDLRLVFEKPKNRINAGAKTRYWQWAEKNGFPWSSLQMGIPEEWMEE